MKSTRRIRAAARDVSRRFIFQYHEIITGRNGVMGFDIRYQRFVKGTGEKNGRRFGLKEGFFPLNHEAYMYGFC